MRILISGSSVFLRSCLELGNAVRPRLAGRDEQTASPRCKGCSGNRNPARETEGSPNAKGRAARRHGVASTPVLLFLPLAPQLRDWPQLRGSSCFAVEAFACLEQPPRWWGCKPAPSEPGAAAPRSQAKTTPYQALWHGAGVILKTVS